MSAQLLRFQQSVFKWYHSNKHVSLLPTRWRRKPAGIDMERNYVSVTLCVHTALVRGHGRSTRGYCVRIFIVLSMCVRAYV